MKSRIHAFLLCALPPLLLCTELSISGNGGSSQTVNAKIVIADTTVEVITDDTAGPRTLYAYSADYLPYEKIGFCDSTDAAGRATLRWKAPAQGTFSFLVAIKPSGRACFLQAVALKRSVRDTLRCALFPCRNVCGFIQPADAAPAPFPPLARYVLSIYGSPFSAVSDSTSGFLIRNVPVGRYTISARSLSKRIMIHTIDYPVMIDSLFENKKVMMLLP
jgi:hypothetical protein